MGRIDKRQSEPKLESKNPRSESGEYGVGARRGCRAWLALGAGLLVIGPNASASDAPSTPRTAMGHTAPNAASAGGSKGKTSDDADKQIAGWIERIRLQPENVVVLAKLDTGAKTSSIYANDIESFEQGGQDWVRYTLVVKESRKTTHRLSRESPVVRKVLIKDHERGADARPVVELELCMNGRRHRARFSLVDRGAFLYSVLLGREFLAGSYVVDPEVTFLTGADCGPESEAP